MSEPYYTSKGWAQLITTANLSLDKNESMFDTKLNLRHKSHSLQSSKLFVAFLPLDG